MKGGREPKKGCSVAVGKDFHTCMTFSGETAGFALRLLGKFYENKGNLALRDEMAFCLQLCKM
jgi:hypothetical protein